MAEVPALGYKIVDVTKVPSMEQGRIGKYDVIVTYSDPAGRTRVVTIPAEEFLGKTPEEQLAILKKYIQAEEGWRRALIGKEVTI